MKAIGAKTVIGRLLGATGIVTVAAAVNIACAGSASAYVGPSYIQIPGMKGNWKGANYTNWIKADGNYWDTGRALPRGGGLGRNAFYAGPAGPKAGAGKLVIGILKDSPVLKQMMKACAASKPIAEMGYVEVSVLARTSMEIGPRPAAMPEYFEYKLKNVEFAGCPVADGAPQQSFILSFKDIERVNYQGENLPIEFRQAEPATLVPASMTSPGRSKSFVLSWFGMANDVSDDQCPAMAQKPTEDDYYRYMSKEDADKERAENAKSGGVNFENGQFGFRGPMKLDAMRLPGVVPDPGNPAPQTKIARGFDLDGDDGTGRPPATTRKHVNYVSPDGRKGIDNQLFTTQGCITSFQGHKGFYMQFSNGQMRDGGLSMVVEITGIDDDQNDDNVEVVFSYSLDPMAKNAAGDDILHDYTFRLTDQPRYTHYFTRLKGRIVNGVIETIPVEQLSLNLGQYGTPNQLDLASGRVRLEILPNGRLKGIIGGYMDWRKLVSRYVAATVENIHGFQVPGLYNALRNGADGLKDPVSGEFYGISAAYDMEGVPVFLQPPMQKVAQASPAQPVRSPQPTP